MPSSFPAPAEHVIESLLAGLMTVPAQVTRAPATDPETDTTGVFAEFATDDDTLAVIAFADHDVVNFVGGALVGVDTSAMQDASGKAELLDETVDGFRRVAEALAATLNTDHTPALSLRGVHVLPQTLAEDVEELWRRPKGRRTYRVTVDDTGAGAIILYLG
jgi:hypothetical protein